MENENKLETTSDEILTEAVNVPTPTNVSSTEVSEESTSNPDLDTVDSPEQETPSVENLEEMPIVEDNFYDVLSEETKGYNVPSFKGSVVDIETIDQYLKANQLKYLDSLIQAEEENKLVEENAKDFMALSREVQELAIKHAEKAMYDSSYFEKNNLSKDLIKPIQILATIRAKREEAKIKSWKIEYYARIVSRLKEFKRLKKIDIKNSIKGSANFRIALLKIRLKNFIKKLCRR